MIFKLTQLKNKNNQKKNLIKKEKKEENLL